MRLDLDLKAIEEKEVEVEEDEEVVVVFSCARIIFDGLQFAIRNFKDIG